MFFGPLTNGYRVANLNDQLDVELLANQNCDFTLFHDGVRFRLLYQQL